MDVIKGALTKVLSFVLIIALIGGCIYFGWNHFISSKKLTISNSVESNIEIIQEKLETAAELNTGSYLCTDVLTQAKSLRVEEWDWNIPLTKKSYIIQYDGIVKAGIKDLTKAKVNAKGDQIIIELPAIEITGIEIDNDSFEVLEENNNIFNPIKLEDLNEAQVELKEEMKKCAIEKGILDLAKTNAETILSSMLSSDYEIIFEWQE